MTSRRLSGELKRAALADWGASIFRVGVAIPRLEHIKDQVAQAGNEGDITKVIRSELQYPKLRMLAKWLQCRSTAYREVRRRQHVTQSRPRLYQSGPCHL